MAYYPGARAMSLAIQNISASYFGKQILHDVSLSVETGEIVAIIGPNGSGKSTLMRVAAGEQDVDVGKVFIDGEPIADMSLVERARRRTVMSQNVNVVFDFTVTEILTMGWLGPLTNLREVMDEVFDMFDLWDLAERRFNSLSGGEQRRVQYARGHIQLGHTETQAQYFLLDEPTANLDVAHELGVLRAARSMVGRRDIGIMLVLHDLNLASRFADRIALLDAGRLVSVGLPEQVYDADELSRIYGTTLFVEQNEARQRLIVHS